MSEFKGGKMEKYIVYVIHEIESIFIQYLCEFDGESELIIGLATDTFITDFRLKCFERSGELAKKYKGYKQVNKV